MDMMFIFVTTTLILALIGDDLLTQKSLKTMEMAKLLLLSSDLIMMKYINIANQKTYK